jgi:16S rRNA processing protein RimM
VALPADAVEVGRVVGAWGVKGGFKVEPYASNPQALFSSKRWFVQSKTALQLLRVKSAKEHGSVVLAQAHDLDDRNAAEALQGAKVWVARSSFPTAGADEYYWVDLIGLNVFNREGAALGAVADLIDTGVHSVLRITFEGGEHLVPFVAAYVDDVNLPERRITVDWQADWSA